MKLFIVHADRLIEFVRRAFPAVTHVGGDAGGDSLKMIRFIQNETEMERVAGALWEADLAFEKVAKPHREAIRAAMEKREAAEKALLTTVR